MFRGQQEFAAEGRFFRRKFKKNSREENGAAEFSSALIFRIKNQLTLLTIHEAELCSIIETVYVMHAFDIQGMRQKK